MKRILTEYTFRSPLIEQTLRFAVAPDLHSGPFDDVLDQFRRCDAVLIPGDQVDRHRWDNSGALRFLETVPELVPVFLSIGNHERKIRNSEFYMRKIAESKAILLDNESVSFRGIRLGGLSSRVNREEEPDTAFLLLCHHPEIYRDYVAGRNIDLTLCGHAHGGQIQICGRGLYAPNQWLFPKMTHGLYFGGRMLLSRGMTNSTKPRMPRFGNPCELIILTLERTEE